MFLKGQLVINNSAKIFMLLYLLSGEVAEGLFLKIYYILPGLIYFDGETFHCHWAVVGIPMVEERHND